MKASPSIASSPQQTSNSRPRYFSEIFIEKMTVKKTSSRDKAEMVEVQGTTEAGASSHQPRKRCPKASVIEASSDRPQTGAGMAGVVEASSYQAKKRGRKATLTPGEKEAKKKACDKKRYYNTKDMLEETREMKPQLEILKNKNAELDSQMGKVNSELLPAITQDMTTMKEDFELVKINFKNMESLMSKFLQREIKENDLMNMEIPMDYHYLEGVENRSMVLALSEHFNGIDDLPTNKLITQGTGSSQTGMSEQHLKQIPDELEKIMNSNKELISENKKLNSKVNALDYKVNALTQDIETLKKNDKCAGTSPTQTLLQENFKQIQAELKELRDSNKELRESNKELILEKEGLKSLFTALTEEMKTLKENL